ncbi:hypothetical protein D3C78_1796770 [compost metagenome]
MLGPRCYFWLRLVGLDSAWQLAPLGIPIVEQLQLCFDITTLAVREEIALIEVQRVFLVALHHHHVLEVENEIRTFVEG